MSVDRPDINTRVEAQGARSNETRPANAPPPVTPSPATEPVTRVMTEEDFARLLRPDDAEDAPAEDEATPEAHAEPGLEADPAGDAAAHDDEMLEAARMLRITRMPDSTPVVTEEGEVGRAFGQWVLSVRCECGRHWFEVEPIYRAHCPKCGKTVFLEMVGDSG